MSPKTTYDPKTKKMVTAEQAKAEQGGYVRISLSQNLADQIVACAKEDGMDFSGKDKDGNAVTESKVRTTNITRQYVEIAVSEWLEARAKVTEDE